MNPPVIAWGVMLGMSLAVGLLNLVIWVRGLQRGNSELGFLLFGITALAVVCVGSFEIRLMSVRSPADATQFLRHAHGVLFVLVVALALFVHVHLGTGRAWLLGAVLVARAAVLIVNFAGDGNIEHLATTELRTVPFLGGQITVVGEAVHNPWAVVLPLAALMLMVYVVDASARLWRTGDARQRMRAVRVGGSVLVAALFAIGVNVLKHYGIVDWPYVTTPAFLFVVLAIGYELVVQVLRSSELSEQLQASRQELQVSEQRLRMATQAAGVGIWEWNRVHDQFHVSATACDLMGLPQAQAIDAATFFARIQDADRTALRTAMEEAFAAEAELESVVRIVDRDGRRRWVVLRGGDGRDLSSKQPLLRGVLADVTDRREYDERLSVVASASPIGITMVNRSGVIVFANRKMETLFGYEPGELLGMPVDALVQQTLREGHASLRRDHFAAGEARAMQGGRDIAGLRKDGKEVLVEISLVQADLHGEPVTLASVMDHGWRREAEREMARQRDELALLTRAALLGELSGSLAHELNQPLTSILINAQATQQLVSQGRLDPGALDEILVDIVNDTRRAGDVIHRLRMLLRHGQSTMERVDLEGIVQEVLRLMSSNLVARQVTVQTAFGTGLPPVFGDRVHLQQVVLNLLMNACEAMTEATGPREVQVGTELDPEGRVRFYVVDTGCGLPQDKHERIFDAFVTTKFDGLGLGLSLCRRIIEHHGGTISARNNAGVGATFEFRLAPAPAPARPRQREQEREQELKR